MPTFLPETVITFPIAPKVNESLKNSVYKSFWREASRRLNDGRTKFSYFSQLCSIYKELQRNNATAVCNVCGAKKQCSNNCNIDAYAIRLFDKGWENHIHSIQQCSLVCPACSSKAG